MKDSSFNNHTGTDMSWNSLDSTTGDGVSATAVSPATAGSEGKGSIQTISVVDTLGQPDPKDISQPRNPGTNQSAATKPADTCNDGKALDADVPVANDIYSNSAVPSLAEDGRGLDGGMAYTWLKDLTTRMSAVEVDIKTSKKDSSDATTSNVVEDAEKSNAYMFRTIPEVRECNWEGFKNYFPNDKGIHAIEVLANSRSLDEEIEAEQLKRLTPAKKLEVLAARNKSRRPQPTKDIGPRRLERVRINSDHVLAALANVTGEKWAKKPHTFLKPFQILIHFHEKMEAEYLRLQGIIGGLGVKVAASNLGPSAPSSDTNGATTIPAPLATDSEDSQTGLDVPKPIEEGTRKACEDLKCYIDFMRSQLLPIYRMFDIVDPSQPPKVRFHDLCSLFRVGELVFVRSTDKRDIWNDREEARSAAGNQQSTEASHIGKAEPLVGKIFHIETNLPDWEVDDLSDAKDGGMLRQDEDPDYKEYMDLSFYHIDHDGEGLQASVKVFELEWYSGEKNITSLPLYPLRFAKDQEQMLKDLRRRGEKFREIVSPLTQSSLSYQGTTLDRTPLGTTLMKGSEHIDSDIIVDFREAYSWRWEWKPDFSTYIKVNHVPLISTDKFDIIRWNGKDRTEILRRASEVVIYNDAIKSLEYDLFLEKVDARFLVERDDRTPEQIAAGDTLLEDDLVMLPSRVFAYALRERKFFGASVRHIKQNPKLEASSTFEQLRISDKHKFFIQSVVHEHFQKKEAQKQGIVKGLELSDQDFIRGKGRGLVILLHGAPGVGKTATAEAVAYAYNKPLFPITCGNLGTEPSVVESNLSQLFRLANLWDCILLLDEAEIFLSPRAKTDDNLQRNALVSVFLRILEYYSGILFLTTNRSGAFDEAVKSRVHLSLLYPHLGPEETLSLFQMNIERLEQIERETEKITGKAAMTIERHGIMNFAKRHFERFRDMEDSRWNGRQIRNAFQIAASLARYQHHTHPDSVLYVGADHFQEVEDATAEYDDFRNRTRAGKTDGEIAFSKGDRGPDQPQRPSRAAEWRLNPEQGPYTSRHRASEYHLRNDATGSPQMRRNWASSPIVQSYPQGGGAAHDNHGEFVGSPSASMSYQAERPSPGPHGPLRTELSSGYIGRDQQYTNSAGLGPSTPASYQSQTQGPVYSPQGSSLAGFGTASGWKQQYRGPVEGRGSSTSTPTHAQRPVFDPHPPLRAEDGRDHEGWGQQPKDQELMRSSLTMPEQAYGSSHGPPESFRTNDSRENGWNSQYRGPEAAVYPPGEAGQNEAMRRQEEGIR